MRPQTHFVNPMVGPRKRTLVLVDEVLAVKTVLVFRWNVREEVAVTKSICA